MKVRILPDAESDLSRAADFYDAQRDGTGDYFIACLAAVIEALKIHAGVHERQHGDGRKGEAMSLPNTSAETRAAAHAALRATTTGVGS